VAAGHHPLPEEFFREPTIRAALSRYDFGPVFRAARTEFGLSQQQLSVMAGLSSARISDVERGRRRLRYDEVIRRLVAGLGIPADVIGPHPDPAGSVVEAADPEVSWVKRRDFITIVTAATLGSTLYPELERLDALLPTQAAPVRRPHIGDADVDAIEAITDGFRRSDFASGAGLCRTAAIAQLHQVRRLESASCSERVRTRLLMATADLAMLTAWLSYDVNEHDTARQLWTFALKTAWQAREHERSTDLTVDILLDTAHQALHLRRPKEALRLVKLASITADDRKPPISAITRSYISVNLGWCRAAMGQAKPSQEAMAKALDDLAAVDPSTTPSWAWYVNDAELAAQQGHAWFLLSETAPAFAPAAIEHLATAVDGYGEQFERSRAVNQASLAASYFRVGDLTTAIATGNEALSAISSLHSARAFERLRPVADAALPFQRNAEVADLRDHIRVALAAA
jgi:transcriptional regulator with XRE-family HTH domain